MEDLPAERVYVLTVTLSVCTETTGCEANHTIFSNLMLPKQPCRWDEGFVNSSMYILYRLSFSFVWGMEDRYVSVFSTPTE